MRILIVSDAWYPQLNGVVRALSTIRDKLIDMGNEVEVIGPTGFRSVPCPTYPEIRLAITGPGRVGRMIQASDPDAVHIATEGPLGWCARHWLKRRKIPFTTSFHTMFPLYLNIRFGLPENWTFAGLRQFHNAATATMYSTETLRALLAKQGFKSLVQWVRGVDTDLFRPVAPVDLKQPGPILMYVGRMAVEKNLEQFLSLQIAGTKIMVGEGPQRAALERRYPEAIFLGAKYADELVAHYAAADVVVFPSKTDTLGLVMLEAVACGIPVAALPVPGPNDVIGDSGAGVLDHDLGNAIETAIGIDPQHCRAHALKHSWDRSAMEFFNNLVPIKVAELQGETA